MDSHCHAQQEHGCFKLEFQGMIRGICTAPVEVVGFIWPLWAKLHQKLV